VTGGRRFAAADLVGGRNAVLEALTAGLPARRLLVASGLSRDRRVLAAVDAARRAGLPVAERPRPELDRRAAGGVHQGVLLELAPFGYRTLDELLAPGSAEPAFLLAADGVMDPGNLGALIRSACAFGVHGLLLPARRAAGVTGAAWKASAGGAARLPVARVPNLVGALRRCAQEGLLVVGLDGAGPADIHQLPGAGGPVVLVVGGEGAGLHRLVRENCAVLARIPTTGLMESLNLSVAAGIALAAIHRARTSAAG
jgi:23S rRNA (guanosine2251-2'-O)-methyltransferase